MRAEMSQNIYIFVTFQSSSRLHSESEDYFVNLHNISHLLSYLAKVKYSN